MKHIGLKMNHEHEKLVNIKTVMELLSCSRASVYRLVQSGQLTTPLRIKCLGTRWRLKDVHAFIDHEHNKHEQNKAA